MKRFFIFALLAQSAFAGELIQIHDINSAALKAFHFHKHQPTQRALSTVNLVKAHELRLLSDHTDERSGIRHKRYQQYFQGLPVSGRQITVHEGPDGTQVNGKLAVNFVNDLIQMPSQTPPVKSKADVMSYFQNLYPYAHIDAHNMKEIIYLDNHDKAHHAYRIEFVLAGEKTRRPVFIVDAQSHRILHYHNHMPALQHVKARAYGGHEDDIHEFGVTPGYPALDISYQAPECYLDNEHVVTYDLKHKETDSETFLAHHPTPIHYTCSPNDFFENFAQDNMNGGIEIENDVHYYGTLVYQMYQDWYNLSPVNGPLILRVHYGENFANAFWDGTSMTFGDGNDNLYPLISLDITGHEVSHGFTQHHSNLDYYEQSGAVNESFSDMAGKAVEYYANGSVNWSVGEGIFRHGHGTICENGGKDAIRCMNDPTLDGMSIRNARHYPLFHDKIEAMVAKGIEQTDIDAVVEFLAYNLVSYYFQDGEITRQKLHFYQKLYTNFIRVNYSHLIKRILVHDYMQGIVVHTASGIYNHAFYLLATKPGWDVRQAFDVMVYANRYYWTPEDQFTDIAFGMLQATKELGYNLKDVSQVLKQIGIQCNHTSCQVV